MSNLIQRTVTGIVFLIVLVGAIIWGPVSFFIIFTALTGLCTYEFYLMSRRSGITPQVSSGIISGIMIFVLSYFAARKIIGYEYFGLAVLFFSIIYIIEIYRKKKKPLLNLAVTLIGILYVAGPFALANFMVFDKSGTYDFSLLLGIFILTWTNDTLAYVFGISFGKHKLLKRVSPKKSWEGFIGGFIFTLGASFVLSNVFPSYPLVDWIIFGIIASVVGTLGDLAESLIKRNMEVKDSGQMLPGHGGVLDRFDSIIFILPVIFAYLLLI